MSKEIWTSAQYQDYLAKPKKKRSKYGSRKHEVDGIQFHSEKEARRYGQLRMMVLAGEITDLELQPEFVIKMEGRKIARYCADFRYQRAGRIMIEDVKSPATRLKESYRIKKKCVEAQYSITILET